MTAVKDRIGRTIDKKSLLLLGYGWGFTEPVWAPHGYQWVWKNGVWTIRVFK